MTGIKIDERRMRAWPAALLAFALIIAACGGGSEDAASATAGDASTTTKSLAALVIIDRDTSVRPVGTGTFRGGTEGEGLGVGDTIQTSSTGFAEIAYFDGSLTRVDRSGEFTLTTLDNTTGARRVEGSLVGGRAWNRVTKATGTNDQFEIDTPVATAAVRGTAFAIDCTTTDACTFTIVEGTVDITPTGATPITVTAPARITIQRNTPPPTPTTIDQTTINADPWIVKNTTRDTTQGKTPTTSTTASSTSTTTTPASTTSTTPTPATPTTPAPAPTTPPAPPSTTPAAPPTTDPPPPPPTVAGLGLAGTWTITYTNVRMVESSGCWTTATPSISGLMVTFAGAGCQASRGPLLSTMTITCNGALCSSGRFVFSRNADGSMKVSVNSVPMRCYPPTASEPAQLSDDGRQLVFDERTDFCPSDTFQYLLTYTLTRQ